MHNALRTLMLRELRAVRREIAAYPDEESLWKQFDGMPNTGGNLALHIAGNLQHFLGATLGNTGYVRDRDAEFTRRVPRADIIAELDRAITAVDRTLNGMTADRLSSVYPLEIAGRRLQTREYLLHVQAHLAYHLGQLDYHRRVVTGESKGVDAVSVKEI